MSATVIGLYTTAQAGMPLGAVPEVRLEPGRGLIGDRYCRGIGTFSETLKDGSDWEVTLIESEEIERFNASEGRSLAPGAFRRNLVTRGVRLNDLVGHRFTLGDAELEGLRLCEPCAYLGGLLGPSVVKAMAHRAGLRARILTGATVRVGDSIQSTVPLRPEDAVP
jgi:MOSC domain-containing protein YiiM